MRLYKHGCHGNYASFMRQSVAVHKLEVEGVGAREAVVSGT
jgi:hypothetical protein